MVYSLFSLLGGQGEDSAILSGDHGGRLVSPFLGPSDTHLGRGGATLPSASQPDLFGLLLGSWFVFMIIVTVSCSDTNPRCAWISEVGPVSLLQ